MWCAVHVGSRREAEVEELIKRLLQSMKIRCFHLARNRRKKYGGRWQTIQEKLFPDYVFIDTDKPEAVYQELKKVPGFRLLSSDDLCVAVLDACESALMEKLADFSGVIEVSKVRVSKNGRIEYVDGPLVNIPEKVRKIDLHRRIAEIEADFMGISRSLYVGIEIDSHEQ